MKNKIRKFLRRFLRFFVNLPVFPAIIVILLAVGILLILPYVLLMTKRFTIRTLYSILFIAYGTAVGLTCWKKIYEYFLPSAKHYVFINSLLFHQDYRNVFFLRATLILNVSFFAYNIITGIIYHSVWYFAMAFFYVILTMLRSTLLRGQVHALTASSGEQKHRQELHSYRQTGLQLLSLDIVLVILAVRMIWRNEGLHYSYFIIYVQILYTLFRAIYMIVTFVVNHNKWTLITGASVNINLCAFLIAVYTLQTAITSAFVRAGHYRRILNIAGGIIVFGSITLLSIRMLVRGTKMQ